VDELLEHALSMVCSVRCAVLTSDTPNGRPTGCTTLSRPAVISGQSVDNVGRGFQAHMMYILGLKLSFQYNMVLTPHYNAERAMMPDYRFITRVQCSWFTQEDRRHVDKARRNRN